MITKNKFISALVITVWCFVVLACQNRQNQETMEQLTERVFLVAAQQYVFLDAELDSIATIEEAAVFPKTYEKADGESRASKHSGNKPSDYNFTYYNRNSVSFL